MNERPIHYEPHPVSPARKAELVAAGYRILDVKFKPKDEPAYGTPIPTVYAGPRVEGAVVWTSDATAAMTVDELKTALTAKGIAFRSNASRASLVALLTKEA